MTEVHIFQTTDGKVYLVKAESELEAKGKMFDDSMSGMIPNYEGKFSNMNDGDVVEL